MSHACITYYIHNTTYTNNSSTADSNYYCSSTHAYGHVPLLQTGSKQRPSHRNFRPIDGLLTYTPGHWYRYIQSPVSSGNANEYRAAFLRTVRLTVHDFSPVSLESGFSHSRGCKPPAPLQHRDGRHYPTIQARSTNKQENRPVAAARSQPRVFPSFVAPPFTHGVHPERGRPWYREEAYQPRIDDQRSIRG